MKGGIVMYEEDEQESSPEVPGHKVADKMGQAAGRGLRKLGNKATKAMAKAGTKLAGKALAAIASFIGSFWPFILLILGILFASFLIYDSYIESRPKNQEYQLETVEDQNDYSSEVGADGYYAVESLSAANKKIKLFYTYFSDRSYYVTYGDGVMDPIQANSEQLTTDGIKDKYDREKYFYLSPNVLFVLDEYLNESKIRTPEQFIRPVPFETEMVDGEIKYKAVDVVDNETEEFNVQSPKYNKEGLLVKGEKTEGVWGYGFAPVLHYKDFIEEHEKRGVVTKEQVWDYENQRWAPDLAATDGTQTYNWDKTAETVWLIDQVVSAMGTIKNNINEPVWKPTSQRVTTEFTESISVPIRKYKTVQSRNSNGESLYYVVKADGTILFNKVSVVETDYPFLVEVPYTVWEKRDQVNVVEGVAWEAVPTYEGEPEEKDITGTDYYYDYMQNYEIYVPTDVMEGFDVQNRLGLNDEEYAKALKEVDDALMSDSKSGGGSSVVGTADIEGLELGSEGSEATYELSARYLEIYKKYGEMYGVDPYLLLAMGAQEGGGDHYNSDGVTVKKAAAVGLMQIEMLGSGRSVSAYNQQTGETDSFSPSNADLEDLDSNIRFSAMYLSYCTQLADGNVLVGLQSYNFGEGFVQYAKKNNSGSWSQELADNFYQGSAGDSSYLQHVLRFYASTETESPFFKDKEGTIHSYDGEEISFGSVDSVNGATLQSASSSTSLSSLWNGLYSAIKSKWEALSVSVQNVFGFKIGSDGVVFYNSVDSDSSPRFLFKNHLDSEESKLTVQETVAFEENLPVSTYADLDDKSFEALFRERFIQMFTNPLGKTAVVSKDTEVNPKEYFVDGKFVTPVDKPKIVTKYGFVKNENSESTKRFHSGVDVSVSSGQAIKAVSKGIVVSVSQADGKLIIIRHINGANSFYSNLGETKVKKGDEVNAGDTIAVGSANKEKENAFHYALQKNGAFEDPSFIFETEKKTGDSASDMANGSVVIEQGAIGKFQSPLPNQTVSVTSPYGYRIDPFGSGASYFHQGIDLVSNLSSAPISAVAEGTVIYAEYHNSYGYFVAINHGKIDGIDGGNTNVMTLYAHMQPGLQVSAGQTVKKGQVLGTMGTTGSSSGTHLHFQVVINNTPGLVMGVSNTSNPGSIISNF